MTTILRRMLWLASVAAVLWLAIWRPQAAATPRSQAATTPQTRTNAPVRTAPAGHRVGATPGQKGATDYWLESQTTRLTARYDDATVAVGQRGTDGSFETKLTDRGGVEVGRFTVSRVGPDGAGGETVLHYAPQAGDSLHVYGDQSVRPTLAWANAQAYTLLKDGAADVASLEWQNGIIRRRGTIRRDVNRQPSELHTEWAGGLSARTLRKSAVNLEWGNRVLNGDVLASRLMRDGVQIGAANWFAKDQVLLWDIPGVTSGSLTAAELTSFGGWPFAPDAEWLNLQMIAFYHFKTAIDKQGSVARRQPGPSSPNRVLDFFVAPSWPMKPAATACTGWTAPCFASAAMCTTSATKNTDATIGPGGGGGRVGPARPATTARCAASAAAGMSRRIDTFEGAL
jgi:hypothetical protein